MKRIRTYRSTITHKQCQKYAEDAKVVQLKNGPIFKDLNPHQVVMLGAKEMKKDGFVLAKVIVHV